MLTSAEFLTPVGPLDAGLLFPGKGTPDVDALFGGYIAAANAAVARIPNVPADQRDGLAWDYVVYLVYDGVVDRMANTPASFSAADEGSISFSAAQLKAMELKRDKALAEYNDAVAGITSAPAVEGPRTSWMRTQPGF